jgi:hypothetical protein
MGASACATSKPKAEIPPTSTLPAAGTPTVSTPAPPVPAAPAANLLSGRLGAKNGPILAVKIDNTHAAHPQAGVKYADVVYVEEVEGGVTRLVAIYSSILPSRLGPVRSARVTDVELLPQYGRIGFAYSGAQRRMLPVLANAPFYLASHDASGIGFWRDHSRPAPYNVFGDARRLIMRTPKAVKPTSVGYTFGPPPAGGVATTHVTARWPSARLDLSWSSAAQRWLVAMDGAPDRAAEGGILGGTTVIVQYVRVVPSHYHDVNGANTPAMITVGHGAALILRNGRAYNGSWSRAKTVRATTYLINGKPAVFAPGQVWVLLVDRTQAVARS